MWRRPRRCQGRSPSGGDGKLTLRHNSRLHHIGLGRRHAGTRILMLIHDLNIRILNEETGDLLRALTLNPNRDYQPQTAA